MGANFAQFAPKSPQFSAASHDFHAAYCVGSAVHRMDFAACMARPTPYVINHLSYSRDGQFLAAALGGGEGIRVYRRR